MNYLNLQQTFINSDEDTAVENFAKPLSSRMHAKLRFLEHLREIGIQIVDDNDNDNEDPNE